MFVLSARGYLEELERHAPAIAAACRAAAAQASADRDFTRLGEAFLRSPSDSIDYAVMEKTSRAAVVPLDAGWNDVGSWSALHDVLPADAAGNVLRGTVLAEDCRGSYIASSSRLVAAIGLRDCVVVETPDAVLVMAKDDAQSVKKIVDALKARKS
jgi:mannose-1-phosphate guanylyltransferase